MRKRQMKGKSNPTETELETELKVIKTASKSTSKIAITVLILLGFVTFFSFYRHIIPLQFSNKNKEEVAQIDNPGIRRIVAVGDLHGDLPNTLKTFKMAGLINDNRDWIAGNAVFVQTVYFFN